MVWSSTPAWACVVAAPGGSYASNTELGLSLRQLSSAMKHLLGRTRPFFKWKERTLPCASQCHIWQDSGQWAQIQLSSPSTRVTPSRKGTVLEAFMVTNKFEGPVRLSSDKSPGARWSVICCADHAMEAVVSFHDRFVKWNVNIIVSQTVGNHSNWM